jgi:predicted HAD superfamily Cof-like phosphohydrolase
MVGCGFAENILSNAMRKADHGDADFCSDPDIVESVDGLCDLLYVVFGSFDAFGIDAEPFFQLVHEANMTKLSGPKDEHGKKLKPPGFVPPQERIRALLVKMGAKL